MSERVVALMLLFAGSVATSYLSTGIVKRVAERTGLVDRPNERKIRGSVTPRVGGLAIIFGFGFPLLLLGWSEHAAELVSKNISYLMAVLASGSLIIALGIYDDLVGANAPKKFTVQTSAAIILVGFGFQFHFVSFGGRTIQLGLFGSLVTILWVVGVINAMNFIDGIDSLATVVSITVALSFVFIALIRRDAFSLVIMTALAGSLLGFLPWNRPPAKIFMGDTGSLFIGLLLATVSIAKSSKSPTALMLGGPMLALALPVIDTLIVMKLRMGDRRHPPLERFARVFRSDRRHIHHVLLEKYGSIHRTIVAIWLVTLLFAGAAVLTVVEKTRGIGYTVGIVAFFSLLSLRYRPMSRTAADERAT